MTKGQGCKLLAAGLLGVSSTFALNDSILVDDLARGLWTGVFLGVEVLGLIVLVEQRRSGARRRDRPLAG